MPSVKRGLQREQNAVPVVDTDKPDTGAQFVHCVSGAYARVFLARFSPFARGIVRQHAFNVCVGMPSKRLLSVYCVRCRRFKAARWWQAPPLGRYGPYSAKDAAQETPWRARGGREGRQKLGCQGAMRARYVQ